MPRLRDLKNNYSSGELDPKLHGRTELKHYFNGAKKMRNVRAHPQGGWSPRWGSIWRDTRTEEKYRLIPFERSVEDHYVFMLTAGTLGVYRRGVLVSTQMSQPWSASDLDDITWCQELDTMLIFHEDWRPRSIVRGGNDATWITGNWSFKNIPQFAYPDTADNGVDEVQEVKLTGPWEAPPDGLSTNDYSFTLSIGGEETDPITFDLDETTMRDRIEDALNALPSMSGGVSVVIDPGSTEDVWDVTFTGNDGDQPWGAMVPVKKGAAAGQPDLEIAIDVQTKGKRRGENVWSDTRGWPRCGTFFQGRLWLAGSRSRPQTVWASRSGDEHDFNTKSTADDFGIDITAKTDQVISINQCFAGRHLQFFGNSAELYVPAADNTPITPKNVVLRRTTQRGAKRGLPVFDVDGATMFLQRARELGEETNTRGEAVGICEFLFTEAAQAYDANDVSLIAAHLFKNPVRWAVRRRSRPDEPDEIYIVNQRGGMIVYRVMRHQEVNSFTFWQTNGEYLDVVADGATVFVMVERIINGNTRYFLEELSDEMFVDAGVIAEVVGAPVTSATGLGHLNGESCWVRGDGMWQADATPSAGSITFANAVAEEWQIGLPWPVVDAAKGWTYTVEDLGVEAELSDGVTFGKKKRTVGVAVRLLETERVFVNSRLIVDQGSFDAPPPRITGVRRARGMLGWSFDDCTKYGDFRPAPVTVLSVVKEIAVQAPTRGGG